MGAAVKKVEVKTNENGAVVGSKGQELWRPGVKSKLAPGEAVFVPLPKAREEGKVKYRDDWIHGNTMLFLGELKRNNDREWLKSEFIVRGVWKGGRGWEDVLMRIQYMMRIIGSRRRILIHLWSV